LGPPNESTLRPETGRPNFCDALPIGDRRALANADISGDAMTDYRAYIVGTDGHFKTSEVIVADDDQQALRIAEKLVDGHDVELWHLDRKIAVLPAKQ
jgi:hypothetical protein